MSDDNDGIDPPSNAHESAKNTRARPSWRQLTFILMLISATCLGVIFLLIANPGEEPPALRTTPQFISIYTSKPGISLHIGLYVFHQSGETDEYVGVAIDPASNFHNGQILLLSSADGVRCASPCQSLKVRGRYGTFSARVDALVINLNGKKNDLGSSGSLIGSYGDLLELYGQLGYRLEILKGPNLIAQTNAHFFVHMPMVGYYQNVGPAANAGGPQFAAAENPKTEGRSWQTVSSLTQFPTITNGKSKSTTAFWNPVSLDSTLTYSGFPSQVRNDDIDSDIPDSGHFNSYGRGDYTFQWQGSGPIDASMTATDPNSTQKEAGYNFIAGVAFAVAAAALIAFIQELPRKKRRR